MESDDFLSVIGNAIRKQRKSKGLTQKELAERSGLKATYMTGIENGKRNTSLLTLGKLVNALEIKPSDLFEKPLEIDPKIYITIETALRMDRVRLETLFVDAADEMKPLVKKLIESNLFALNWIQLNT